MSQSYYAWYAAGGGFQYGLGIDATAYAVATRSVGGSQAAGAQASESGGAAGGAYGTRSIGGGEAAWAGAYGLGYGGAAGGASGYGTRSVGAYGYGGAAGGDYGTRSIGGGEAAWGAGGAYGGKICSVSTCMLTSLSLSTLQYCLPGEPEHARKALQLT